MGQSRGEEIGGESKKSSRDLELIMKFGSPLKFTFPTTDTAYNHMTKTSHLDFSIDGLIDEEVTGNRSTWRPPGQ